MNVLVLNCGSSSVKFQVISLEAGASADHPPDRLARGEVERIGEEAVFAYEIDGASGRAPVGAVDHAQAVSLVLARLDLPIEAVGHRVVHGGDRFSRATLITEQVLGTLEDLNEIAPLHNPASVSGIRAARAVLGTSVPMVAAFDTSFHTTVPDYAATYALPYEMAARHHIRRYGFHGLAHRSMALRYAELVGVSLDQVTIVTLQLGNGCSATAIKGGISVDTSMGFTPLEGLVMGTRSGDLDPAIVAYLAHKEDVGADQVERWLNQDSGLLGISGLSQDMRDLTDEAVFKDNPRARLAVEVFCYRARKYLGAYLAVLGGAQAVVFGGGIGENSPLVRAEICRGMEWCGLVLDQERNDATIGREGRITTDGACLQAYVIPPDEELLIAQDTLRCIDSSKYPR